MPDSRSATDSLAPGPGPGNESDRADCLICGGATLAWLVVPCDWRRPERSSPYRLQRCPGCGFRQIVPRPAREEIASFYQIDNYYTHSEQLRQTAGENRRLLDRLRMRLAWSCDRGVELDDAWFRSRLAAGGTICDLGCGSGALLARLAQIGFDVTGVEPDPNALAVASRRIPKVFPGTAEDLPSELQAQRFDCLVMSHVLEHTLDPRRAVENAAGLLNAGGLLVIETPNNEAEGLRRSAMLWPWLDVPRHLNFFTGSSLRRLCEAVGLRVEGLEYRGYARQFGERWINRERSIRDIFLEKGDAQTALPSARRFANAWKLLAATAWAPPPRKYDSVRILARRA